jgi:LPS sulfotransferase NodH
MSSRMDIEKIKQTPIFFIVGRPRTGSTLLRTLFDAHPNVTIPVEWPLLLALHKRFGHIKQWDKKMLEEFYNGLFEPLRYKYWSITNWPEINFEQLHSDLVSCNGETSFETLIKIVYSHYHSFFEKKDILLFGDKNPVYSNQTNQLAKIFPGSKFIHLTRDYRDNIVSMLDVDFEMPNVALLAYRWKYSFQAIDKISKKNPERFIRIRYEDLVAEPKAAIGELCNFLEISFEPAVLEFHKKKSEIEQLYPKEITSRYFSSLFQPIDSNKTGIYKARLTGRQVKIADQTVGNTAEAAGYQRDYVKFNFLLSLWIFPAVLYSKWLYSVGWMVGLLPYRQMMWLLNKPSFIVKIYTRFFADLKTRNKRNIE